MTISLPQEMIDQVEKVRKDEHRRRSQLVREALRTYFSNHFAKAPVSAAELRAIRRGRAQIRRGEYVSLDELFNDVESKIAKQAKKSLNEFPPKTKLTYCMLSRTCIVTIFWRPCSSKEPTDRLASQGW